MEKLVRNNEYFRDIFSKISDLKKKDIVYVTSDMTDLLINFKKVNKLFNGNDLIDAIIEKVGPEGTILIPCFNWDFCKGKKFNYLETPPQIGSLPKIAFKREDFKRTKHPIYSFLVWGKDKEYLFSLKNKSGWGSDSPFSYFYKNKAKQLFIGIDYKKGFTFMHHPEEKLGTKYRYFKTFTSQYIDERGKEKTESFIMNVIDLEKSHYCRIDPRMDKVLLDNNAYFKYLIDGINFSIVDLKIAGDLIEKEIKSNKSFFVYKKRIKNI